MNKIYFAHYTLPEWMTPDLYRSLNNKEQDYIILRYSAKMEQSDIKRALFFNSKSGYIKFRKKIHEKIKDVHSVDNM